RHYSIEDDGAKVEESPASILVSLHSYKEALADNNASKISEIETHLKSVMDEKLVLERQLAALSDELSSAKYRILRISTDFDNFRKTTERERISLVANAQGEVVESLLPVLDNYERAKAAIKADTEKEDKINNSYQGIYKQFVEILIVLGVVPVETTGQPFAPLLHEAILREESSEFNDGVVIQKFREGFRIGDRLLRPSMVKVSAGPGPESTERISPSEPALVGAWQTGRDGLGWVKDQMGLSRNGSELKLGRTGWVENRIGSGQDPGQATKIVLVCIY
ncbi:uncharacterized protein, partial [Rutidosis leptorrhynchoides]|uniref:uncharacterized protein n=1 Tax=Rutidosis leptorrhynchoides TaxID=125765 RepID=UPI003A99E72F